MYNLVTIDQNQYESGSRFVGLNSNRDFVFETEESSLMFYVITAKDLFYMLVTGEVRFIYSGYYDLSLDEVKTLYDKLNKSYHHTN